MFEIGQQVVCIEGLSGPFWFGELPTETGRVYTIRGVIRCGDELGLYLVEIRNPVVDTCMGRVERAYNSTKFRPVKKTDISVFQSLLAPIETAKRKLEKV